MNVYDDIVESLQIQNGDNIWLSSELIKLMVVLRKKGITFDGNELINAFQRKLTASGTLMIPTFNFDFSNNGFYDYVNSAGSVGVLGNIALKRKDFIRTRHPLHSFAVWGKYQDSLTKMNNSHSFGVDSPFSFCVGHHVKQILLGTDYERAMTFVHYAEAICDVPYRFHKIFEGEYTDENGKKEIRKYDYSARYLEIEPKEISNFIGKILEEKKISIPVSWNDVESFTVDLAASLPIICDDIVNNQCKNIYEFNISRDFIFK